MLDMHIPCDIDAALPSEPCVARHFVDGALFGSADGAITERVWSSRGILVRMAARGGEAETEAVITAPRQGLGDGRWRRSSGAAHAAALMRVADMTEANAERLAVIETLDSCKPSGQSRKVAFGNPLPPDTQVRAIVTQERRARIVGCVRAAVAAGARIRLGSAPMSVAGPGDPFFQPTIRVDVTPDMAMAGEETFGPVLSVLIVRALDEAVALSNDAPHDLSDGVWSENVHTCLDFARRGQSSYRAYEHLERRLSRTRFRRRHAIRSGEGDRPIRIRRVLRGESPHHANRQHPTPVGRAVAAPRAKQETNRHANGRKPCVNSQEH